MSKYDNALMETAKIWAKESKCRRRQVGAILSKDGRILVTGYNGTIAGKDNSCEKRVYKCRDCGNESELYKAVFNEYMIEPIMHTMDPYANDLVFKTRCIRCNTVSRIKANKADGEKKIFEKARDKLSELVTSDLVLHAEQNIIAFAAKNGISTDGTTIHITTSPCQHCAKLIAQSGIERVVYLEEYKDTTGIKFLKNIGIEVVYMGDTI